MGQKEYVFKDGIRLYFGLYDREGKPKVTEKDWEDFLTKHIVPIFKNFSVSEGVGYYTNKKGKTFKEPYKCIFIISKGFCITDNTMKKLNKTIEYYKKTFDNECVLSIISDVSVNFI